jgi:excisionase family DNA binding protein
MERQLASQEEHVMSRQTMSYQEAAQFLGVSVGLLRKWKREGRLEVIKLGRRLVRIPISEVQRIESEGMKVGAA